MSAVASYLLTDSSLWLADVERKTEVSRKRKYVVGRLADRIAD